MFSQKVRLQRAALHCCVAGGTANPTVQPGTDTTLPGVTGPTPDAAAPAASLGLAGGMAGTSTVPQSLLQFGMSLRIGSLRDDSRKGHSRCQALQSVAAKLLLELGMSMLSRDCNDMLVIIKTGHSYKILPAVAGNTTDLEGETKGLTCTWELPA